MKKQIGFEYEGYISGSDQYKRPVDIIVKTKVHESYKNIYARDGDSLFQHLEKGYFYQNEWRDNYARLAEMRFKPVDLDSNPKEFVDNLYFIKDNAFQNVLWKEVEVPEDEHKYSLQELEYKTQLEQSVNSRLLLDRKNFIGEILEYNFKQPLTIVDDKITTWESDNTCRNRGGGLHINISPLEPAKVKDFIQELHKRLSLINEKFQFKSNYRQQLLFRYRKYGEIPGVEYMSIGINMDDINKDEVEAIFSKIFKEVNNLL